MRTCANPNCDVSLEGSYPRRKWCSEACRKRVSYAGVCQQCGAPTAYSGQAAPSPLCVTCGQEATAEANRAIHAPYRETVERLWAQGLTMREILIALGRPYDKSFIASCRTRGYNLPYRQPWRIPYGQRFKKAS